MVQIHVLEPQEIISKVASGAVWKWTSEFEFFDIFQFPSRDLLDLAS